MYEPDGVIAFAGVDWWYHNRGHSECQIMRRLGAEVPVLWVNSIGMRTPTPGKSDLVLRRYARKLRSTLKGLRRDESGMWVLSPLFIPRYTARWLRINGWFLRAQIRFACRRVGIHQPAVWITIPTAAHGIDKHWRPIVFNRSDEFSAFPEVDHDLIAHLERNLLSGTDHVLYANHELMDSEVDVANQPEFLGHGVDFDHFAGGASLPEPEGLSKLPRPLIGFYGALDDYTIDLDLMIATARGNPHATLLVIGPQQMDLDRLVNEPNVVYLGPVPYEELPAYSARFDIGIMPWLDNDWIRRCNPIKLKEYLATGFPIATTDFPELEPYRHLIHVGIGTDGFVSAVRSALDETADISELRRDSVRASGWDDIADRVAALLRVG